MAPAGASTRRGAPAARRKPTSAGPRTSGPSSTGNPGAVARSRNLSSREQASRATPSAPLTAVRGTVCHPRSSPRSDRPTTRAPARGLPSGPSTRTRNPASRRSLTGISVSGPVSGVSRKRCGTYPSATTPTSHMPSPGACTSKRPSGPVKVTAAGSAGLPSSSREPCSQLDRIGRSSTRAPARAAPPESRTRPETGISAAARGRQPRRMRTAQHGSLRLRRMDTPPGSIRAS